MGRSLRLLAGITGAGLTWPAPTNRASQNLVKFVFGEEDEHEKALYGRTNHEFLKEAEAGIPVKELCRQHGFSDASFYTWRAKFGGMEVSEARRLKDLETENARLKKLLAEAMLDMEALKIVVKGKP
ncbi:transposase IS3/IS911 family protein [Burkholderia ambifaria MEX-5]|uniref:Transposase IS3/IS911 family protein n=1 Tax=Burkholderia ambifaria MEX-5 TaxID=396597 RepID=B1T4S1_9BURK|nr:transposase IS3/IS911 family protein [Burkholderia ambifaria MEX-5]